MHQVVIPRQAKNRIGQFYLPRHLPFLIVHFSLHWLYPLISRAVPLLPGRAPEINILLFSLSILRIFKFLTVTRSEPILPAMRMPFRTLCSPAEPIEPG